MSHTYTLAQLRNERDYPFPLGSLPLGPQLHAACKIWMRGREGGWLILFQIIRSLTPMGKRSKETIHATVLPELTFRESKLETFVGDEGSF